MIRRTEDRRAIVLAAIRTPKTVAQIAAECSISYMNAYYALQTLIDDRMCHVCGSTSETGSIKLMDLYLYGSIADPIRDSIETADKDIRTAVSLWVKSRPLPEDEEDAEIDP